MDRAVFASGVFKDDSAVVAFDRSYFVDLRVSAVLTTAVYELVAVLRAIPFRFRAALLRAVLLSVFSKPFLSGRCGLVERFP
jgi:hypothetical protein